MHIFKSDDNRGYILQVHPSPSDEYGFVSVWFVLMNLTVIIKDM
jgi:hypothetical protein